MPLRLVGSALRLVVLCFLALGVASPAWADVVVTFSPAVNNVPESHDAMTGGILSEQNQNFQEVSDGVNVHVEGFWAYANTPTSGDVASGYYTDGNNGFIGHFHTVGANSLSGRAFQGYEESHGWSEVSDGSADLQGLFITLVDGGSFDLVSLDWDMAYAGLHGDNAAANIATMENPYPLEERARDIWISTSFDPANYTSSGGWGEQFTKIKVTENNNPVFETLTFDAVEGLTRNITSVFITADLGSTLANRVRWDNITLSPTAVPEASPMLIWPAMALVAGGGLVIRNRRAKRLASV